MISQANDVLQAIAAPTRGAHGGLNHLDYLPSLENARPSTALRFPGCRQIAAYRAGTSILILPRTHPGNSWRARLSFLSETARNNKRNRSHHRRVVPPRKKWSVVPTRARFVSLTSSPALCSPNLIFIASHFPKHYCKKNHKGFKFSYQMCNL